MKSQGIISAVFSLSWRVWRMPPACSATIYGFHIAAWSATTCSIVWSCLVWSCSCPTTASSTSGSALVADFQDTDLTPCRRRQSLDHIDAIFNTGGHLNCSHAATGFAIGLKNCFSIAGTNFAVCLSRQGCCNSLIFKEDSLKLEKQAHRIYN